MTLHHTSSSPRHDHVYAIVRYDADACENTPINVRVTVKKIVTDEITADAEVRRLNELNKEKGVYYFSQVTRIEKGALESIGLPTFSSEVLRENNKHS